MGKTYSLEDGESLLAELKSTRGKMAEMKGRSSSARLLPTRRKNYKPLPKDNGEGQKEVA